MLLIPEETVPAVSRIATSWATSSLKRSEFLGGSKASKWVTNGSEIGSSTASSNWSDSMFPASRRLSSASFQTRRYGSPVFQCVF